MLNVSVIAMATNLFERQQQMQLAAGLDTSPGCLICPLCWSETTSEELTVEHIIPGAVGGRQTVLTCKKCNSSHGSKFDSHLASYMKECAAMQGAGTIPTEMFVGGYRLAANLSMNEGFQFQIVGEATDPRSIQATQGTFMDKAADQFTFRLRSKFSKYNLRLAILRAAYLCFFDCFGYHPLRASGMQQLRQKFNNPELPEPPIDRMVVWLEGFAPDDGSNYFIWTSETSKLIGAFVAIRLRYLSLTKYVAAYLPAVDGETDAFYDVLLERSRSGSNLQTLKDNCWTDE